MDSEDSVIPIAGVAEKKIASADEAILGSRVPPAATKSIIKRKAKLRSTPNLVKRLSLSASAKKLRGEVRIGAPSTKKPAAAQQQRHRSDDDNVEGMGDSNSFASLAASESEDEEDELECLDTSIRQLQQRVLAIKAKQTARREKEDIEAPALPGTTTTTTKTTTTSVACK